MASFVASVTGPHDKQVSYASPRDIQNALPIALSVQEGEKPERFDERFYARFDNSVSLLTRSPGRKHKHEDKFGFSPGPPAVNHSRSQRYMFPHSTSKLSTSANRNALTQAEIRCYEFEGLRSALPDEGETPVLQTHEEKEPE